MKDYEFIFNNGEIIIFILKKKQQKNSQFWWSQRVIFVIIYLCQCKKEVYVLNWTIYYQWPHLHLYVLDDSGWYESLYLLYFL